MIREIKSHNIIKLTTYLQLIANRPKLQICLIVSVQNLTSKNYRYCKLIVNEPQLHLAAIYFNFLNARIFKISIRNLQRFQ